MTITQEKIDPLLSNIKISLQKEDYEPLVKKQLKALNKKVQIKGFRPGMVPSDMVKKMYGNEVLAEELDKMLNDEIYKYINENKLDIIASPIPAQGQKLDIDIDNIRDVEFNFEIGHNPEVSLAYLESSPGFTKYRIQADDKMVEEEVLRIRNRFATYEYPETVGEKDVLTVTIEELGEDGNLKPGGVSTVSSLMPDLLKEEYRSKVVTLKKQESFEADVFDLMDRDRQSMAKNVLNLEDTANIEEIGNKFRITLDNITRSVPAEINEEFFQKVYGEHGPKTEEEMRKNIKQDLESYFDGQTDSYVVNDLYKAMMENVEIALPEDFLKRWLLLTNKDIISEENIETDFPLFIKQMRWDLIQKKIKEQENINVTSEEIHDRVRNNIIQQLYSYGLKNIEEEWVEQLMKKQLTDNKVLSQTRDQILEDKVMAYLKTKVTLHDKPVTMEEFKALVEKK